MTASEGHVLSAEQPFPGLRPFTFGDHGYFFGREDQTFALFRLLDRSQFIAVVGASGSGKSSLVRAGLLPLLSKDSQSRGGRSWRWAQMRPGVAPLANLADCLESLADREDPIISAARRDRMSHALHRSSFGLRDALREIEHIDKASIVLIVDQFEELFRYAAASAGVKAAASVEAWWREEATHFIQLLLAAQQDSTYDVHVIITMRSDFIGDCARFYGLPEAVSATQFLVPSLTRDQLEDIIRRPVEKADATMEPELVERIINDSDNDLDELPVLQHCLLRLWERAGRALPEKSAEKPAQRHLTIAQYNEIGGVAHALSMHADEILVGLHGQELAVEQVFRALSELDREGRAIRRALPFSQLLAEAGIAELHLRLVLDRFRAEDCSFLVPSLAETPDLTADAYIDVGHEALLRRWERLSAEPTQAPGQEPDAARTGWLRAEDNDGRLYRGLLALAQTGGQASRATLPLDQVGRLSAWWTERPRTAAWAARYGGARDQVDKLFERSRDALAAERIRQEALVAKDREAVAARLRLQRRIMAASAAALVTGLILVGLAYWQWREATAARDLADKASDVAAKEEAANFALMTDQSEVFRNKLAPGKTLRDQLKDESKDKTKWDPISMVAEAKAFLLLARTAVSANPENPDNLHFLALSTRQMADVMDTAYATRDSPDRLDLYNQSAQMLEQAIAQRPDIAIWQEDLSVSYDRVGDRLLQDSQVANAEQAYRKSLAISVKLSSGAPGDLDYLNDVAISYEKIGLVLVDQNRDAERLDIYRKAAAAWQKMVASNSKNSAWQLSLVLSQAKIAELESDHDQSIKDYNAVITKLVALAGSSGASVQVQWDLLVVQDNLGNAYATHGDYANAITTGRAALATLQKIANKAPADSGLKVNMALRHGRIGDLLKLQGDLAAALQEYQQQQAAFDSLAKLSASDADLLANCQLDLAEVDRKIGDVLIAQGKRAEALDAYRSSLSAWEQLATVHPDDVSYQRGLVLANWVLAAQGDDAVNRLSTVVTILRKLSEANKLPADQAQWLTIAQEQLADLQSK